MLKQNSVETINVQHDVELQGKTLKHQIDVYWEFEHGGVNYQTIVQCKDWGNPVSQGELLKFKAVLDDLPSQPRGIFVTRTGYQSGALEFARANGILIYELREPTDKDWEGRVKTININMAMYIPHSKDTAFHFDEEWISNEAKKYGIKKGEMVGIRIEGMENEIDIYDEKGNPFTNVHEIIRSMFPKDFQELPETPVEHIFEKTAFVRNCADNSVPMLKINSISATISVGKIESTTKIDGEHLIGFILRNVVDGSEELFDKSGKLRNSSQI